MAWGQLCTRQCLGGASLLLWLLALPTAARAQTPSPLQEWQYPGGIMLRKLFDVHLPTWQFVLGAGTAFKPIYDGSRTYKVEAGPAIDIRYSDIAFASSGEGIGVNVLRGANYRAGIALAYDMGRLVSQNPSRLRGLGDIEPAPVVKLFAAYTVSKAFPLVVRADIRRLVGGANGWVGDVGAYMPLPGSSRRLAMFAGPSITFGAGGYMQHEFGVDAVQALRSGYPRYRASAGLEAVGMGFSLTWFFTRHWLVNADTAVGRLLGSAADSPITQNKAQSIVVLSVAYRW
jgi:outer membrane scaffolding protein for murein synthesis (MipA/OmpV family)